MNLDFTVAVPTYNGAKRLPLVLEKLRSQIGIDHLSWEIIIVDNNSSDNTAEVIRAYQAEWNCSFPLHYYSEPQQGAAYARQHAVQAAQGVLVGFLDDDNLPASDWVSAAYQFALEHPDAGAFGSQIHGVFEVEPSQELRKILFYLAIVERGSNPHRYNPRQNGFPPSAGLVVRRQVWLNHVPSRLLLVGWGDAAMLPGEDFELLSYIHGAGWEVWYNPKMELDHCIPAQRLEREYLVTVMRAIGLCSHHLRMLRLQPWERPLAFWFYLANDSRKALRHFLRYRTVLATDIVAACEMERLLGNISSPFYLWRLQFNQRFKPKAPAQKLLPS